MTNLQIFNFNNSEVRVEMVNNVPYFCGRDVAEVLGFGNTRQALATHCTRAIESTTLSYRGNHFKMIPESDVYRLVMRSQLPSAARFQDWVCEEVLPRIRQTGGYQREQPQMTQIQLLAQIAANMAEVEQQQLETQRALVEQAQQVDEIEMRTNTVETRVDTIEQRMDNRDCDEGFMLRSDAHREYGRNLSRNKFYQVLDRMGVESRPITIMGNYGPQHTSQVNRAEVIEKIAAFYAGLTQVSTTRFTHPLMGTSRFQA